MKIKLILILFFVSVFKDTYAQYYDEWLIYEGSGIFSDREPIKSIYQTDLDIIKSNKVKKIKVTFAKDKYLVYKVSDKGLPEEINQYSNKGKSCDLQILNYYNDENKIDSISYSGFDKFTSKFFKHSRHFIYKDNKLYLIAGSSNDTIHSINNYFYDTISKREPFFLHQYKLSEHRFNNNYLVHLYDSSVCIKDYSLRQWTQTDSIYRNTDTIIDKQNYNLEYKIILKNNRIEKTIGKSRVVSLYEIENTNIFFLTAGYYYRKDGLIDYLIVSDNEVNQRIKFQYFYN